MKPKKSLGQNWLVDKTALAKIVEAAELTESDNVLEIGPGTGALSAELIKNVGKVIMVEKDEALAEAFARKLQIPSYKFQTNFKFQISNFKSLVATGDILEINLPKLLEECDFTDYKLVANIPYYITGKLLRLIFETKYRPKLIVLLVQKEVAERVCAQPGQMSKLAVMVQLNGQPEIVDHVPKESFRPVPKVDSAILKIKPFDTKNDEKLLRLVRIGFASRRKTLVNNLSAGLQLDKKAVEETLAKIGQDPKTRAQDLSIEDWQKLSGGFE